MTVAQQTAIRPTAALVLRKRQVCAMLGISPATLDRQRVKGDFPAPIRLGEQAIGWPLEAVQAWIDSCPVAHHFGETVDFMGAA